MNKNLLNKLITIFGGAIVVTIILLSWFPSRCPVLKDLIIGCSPRVAPLTPTQIEEKRIPHQRLATNQVFIEVAAQEDRAKTRVTFAYNREEGKEVTFGFADSSGNFTPLAIVHAPIFEKLTWNRLASSSPTASLYYPSTPAATTISGFLELNQPIIADSGAARSYGLSADRYTALNTTADPATISTPILTSYTPGVPEGDWKWFEQIYDLSSLPLKDGKLLVLEVRISNATVDDPFLLGEVHVDYRK